MDHDQSTTMAQALRLTRAGRVAEATALIQGKLAGSDARSDAPGDAPGDDARRMRPDRGFLVPRPQDRREAGGGAPQPLRASYGGAPQPLRASYGGAPQPL